MRRALLTRRPLLEIICSSADAVFQTNTTNTTQNVAKPANLVVGSFLLAWSAITSANTLNTPTGGATWIGGSTSGSGWGVWWKAIPDSATLAAEPSTYTFTGATLVSRHTVIVPFLNVDMTTPVAGSGTAVARTTGSGAPNSPAVTPDFAGQLLLSLFTSVNSSAATTAPPTGMTKLYEGNNTQTRALAAMKAVAGSNDPDAWGMASSNHGSASLILNPARAA